MVSPIILIKGVSLALLVCLFSVVSFVPKGGRAVPRSKDMRIEDLMNSVLYLDEDEDEAAVLQGAGLAGVVN